MKIIKKYKTKTCCLIVKTFRTTNELYLNFVNNNIIIITLFLNTVNIYTHMLLLRRTYLESPEKNFKKLWIMKKIMFITLSLHTSSFKCDRSTRHDRKPKTWTPLSEFNGLIGVALNNGN